MTALIFGSNGQDGLYLSSLLTAKGINVTGISRSGNWTKGDVSDHALVTAIIKEKRPDFIFHLAANSTTAHDAWLENHRTICDGTLFVLEAVRQHSQHTKVFISGSGLQFENHGRPISETDPFHAGSPYAVSRIQSVYAARYYRSLGVHCYVGYFFNHESPQRTERHMSKKVASFAKRVAGGNNEKLTIGDITVKKEWTFAGDTVEAVWKLVSQTQSFEAVLGSGKAYSIEEWLDACFTLIGKDWKSYIQLNKSFKAEYDILVSNPVTIKRMGWEPQTSFSDLAKLMMK